MATLATAERAKTMVKGKVPKGRRSRGAEKIVHYPLVV
jgi:hypothetical protein